MPGLADVKEAFKGNRGKVLIIGGVALTGYLYWTRVRTAAPADSGGAAQDTIGADGRIPPTGGPTVGNDTQTTGPSRPQSNDEWLANATDYLTGQRKVPATDAYNALYKALQGSPLSSQEGVWVGWAISYPSLGTPPEGMPALNISKPVTPPQQSPPKPTNPPPSGSTVTYTVKSGDTLSGIARRYGVSESTLYQRNAAVIEAAARAHGLSSSAQGHPGSLGWWIFSGTKLVIK